MGDLEKVNVNVNVRGRDPRGCDGDRFGCEPRGAIERRFDVVRADVMRTASDAGVEVGPFRPRNKS